MQPKITVDTLVKVELLVHFSFSAQFYCES